MYIWKFNFFKKSKQKKMKRILLTTIIFFSVGVLMAQKKEPAKSLHKTSAVKKAQDHDARIISLKKARKNAAASAPASREEVQSPAARKN